MTLPQFDPIQGKPAHTPEERRAYFRSYSFYHPSDLAVYRSPNSPGDDGRADLPTSEILCFMLLANRSPAVERRVFGHASPILCVTHSRQPLCGVVWDKGRGLEPFITDGRQRGGDSTERGEANPGAIEAINRRLRQLVDLAVEIAGKDADAAGKPEVLKVKTRSEAAARFKRGDVGWEWAEPISLPLYVGGKIGDAAEPGLSPPSYTSMIDWASSPPRPIPYVAWVAFEPEDRDPAHYATQLASLGLKGAQVATPPTKKAYQFQSLCAAPAPAKQEGETDEQYANRIAHGGPYGQGLPVRFVAKHDNLDSNSVQLYMRLLDLEPEVQQAVDAGARGEEGLSLKQVRDGGFFVATSGGPGGKRIPKTREEQLKLLAELQGKRGVRRDGSSVEDDADTGTSRSGRSGEGGEGWSDPSRKREVSGDDSAGARHSAEENRAPVGPDSMTTAGIAPRAARLDGSLFAAIRDRVYSALEGVTPDEAGLMPDGTERSAEHRILECVYETAYQFAAYFAGDAGAFAPAGSSPTLLLGCSTVKAALDEVLRVKGLTVAQGVGVVSTGVPVLRTADRDPAELIVTPRKDGEVRTVTDSAVTAPDVGAEAAAPAAASAVASPKPAKAVKAPKAAKPPKVPKPRKEARRGPLKPAKVKAPKVVKPPKEPKVKEPKVAKAPKADKVAKLPKPDKAPKADKEPKTPKTPKASAKPSKTEAKA